MNRDQTAGEDKRIFAVCFSKKVRSVKFVFNPKRNKLIFVTRKIF